MASYPSSIVNLTNPGGGSSVAGVHAALHGSVNDEIEAIETTLGTNSGTYVLKNFTAGQLAMRVNTSGVMQDTVTAGTLRSVVLGTPVIGSQNSTGGTIAAAAFNNGTLGTTVILTPSGPAPVAGDMYYYQSSVSAVDRLALGTQGNRLISLGTGAGSPPQWVVPPQCLAYLSGTQSIPTGTYTALAFNAENYDTQSMHTTGGSNTRFTIPNGWAGRYMIIGGISYAGNASGNRFAAVYKNGTLTAQYVRQPGAAGGNLLNFTAMADGTPGDYFEVWTYQDSGGTLGATGAGSGETFAGVVWL